MGKPEARAVLRRVVLAALFAAALTVVGLVIHHRVAAPAVSDVQLTADGPPTDEPRTAEPQTSEPRPIHLLEPEAPTLVRIGGGGFWMGERCQFPRQQWSEDCAWVEVATFDLMKTEVTNAQYQACVTAEGCTAAREFEGFTGANHPVTGVDWHEARTYCDWAGNLYDDAAWRLPTAAEWEKAAVWGPDRDRDDNPSKYPWGDAPTRCEFAQYGLPGNTRPEPGDVECPVKGTAAVGSHPLGDSAYGVSDMAGNVWEWCSSRLGPDPYDPDDGREALPPIGQIEPLLDGAASRKRYRVQKGGSWTVDQFRLRSSFREDAAPEKDTFEQGFRCAR